MWAVLFDLGDTLMVEASEEKDATETTQRADLFDGAADLLWSLKRQGYLVGLVADTRPGTARNVLRQHGIEDAFDVLAISELLGTEKPDPRMFRHALRALGLRDAETGHVAMVGNRVERDVRGANALGLISVLMRHNDRYPATPSGAEEEPQYTVRSLAELGELLRTLG